MECITNHRELKRIYKNVRAFNSKFIGCENVF